MEGRRREKRPKLDLMECEKAELTGSRVVSRSEEDGKSVVVLRLTAGVVVSLPGCGFVREDRRVAAG